MHVLQQQYDSERITESRKTTAKLADNALVALFVLINRLISIHSVIIDHLLVVNDANLSTYVRGFFGGWRHVVVDYKRRATYRTAIIQVSCTLLANMGFNDLLHFDEDEYKIKIAQHPDEGIYTNILKKRRQAASSGTSIGMGVALAHVTGGASLVSSAYNARTLDIANKKLELLEEEWEARGHEEVPKNFFRDRALPIAATGTASAVMLGLDAGISTAGAGAVTQVGANDAGQVLYHAGHGYAVNVAAPAQSLTAYHAPTPNIEHIMGKEAVKAGMHFGVNKAVNKGQEHVAKSWK